MHMNLTPAEQYRINGRFTDATACALLDLAENHKSLDAPWACSAIREVKGCLPKEDDFTEILGDMRDLHKHLRGANKDRLQQLLDKVEKLSEEQRSNYDHGHEQLNKVHDALSAFPKF